MISESAHPFGLTIGLRRTRRWLVAGYWLLITASFVPLELGESKALTHTLRGAPLLPLQILVFLPALLGGVRTGGLVKPFRGTRWVPLLEDNTPLTIFAKPHTHPAEADLDERETLQRDRVHFLAYTVSRWMVLGLMVLYCIVNTWNPLLGQRLGVACFCLVALTLWSLPQSMILWTEPDMEEAR